MRQQCDMRSRVAKLGGRVSSSGLDGFTCVLLDRAHWLYCIVSWGLGWEHVSVHSDEPDGKLRTPTWAEMCLAKETFWHDEEAVVQFHPPKSQYVNRHPHTLHLWKPCKEEFPRPPLYMV